MTHSQALSRKIDTSSEGPIPPEGQGLMIDEPLIFEKGSLDITGVDWPDVEIEDTALAGLTRDDLELHAMSEPEVVRHYTRLSHKNYGIDTGLFPLGSCTMKHNPRINEKIARFFAPLHPMQPTSTAQGALEVIHTLSEWICELTGHPAVAMSPAAGAQGELCGIMTIKAAIKAKGEDRHIILVPESAHGTNPATAAACGFDVKTIPANNTGRVTVEEVKAHLNPDVAGIMLTNPNTCGLFENQIKEIADALHEVGAYFYCDGANFNAIVGRVKPADLGIDCMHLNLHKTFSTPHGGGGPGSGPVVLSQELAAHAPFPTVIKKSDDSFDLIEQNQGASIGRLKGFHGQMGMFTRALAYMMSHGADGLRQVSEDAVLNANYLLARLKDTLTPAYPGTCMHEALFDDQFLKGTNISTLDFSKALIDRGYHPMTMYFPLVVSGALLVEPTETETQATLDHFADTLIDLVREAKAGNTQLFTEAPTKTPRRRLDETKAARQPVLRWSR